ncbi:MAG TPA: metalloprotease family protein [Candidatus Thermoplasmatota archaeon]|nr:metalloprotease family protein [Candidatus Thermoplasmatota archaeon]
MDYLLQLTLGVLIAILLHELSHFVVLIYYKIPIQAIVLTKWSAVGFLVDNETYVTNNKKLFFLHFAPLIGCLLFFINTHEPFFWMFPFVNIFGGIGDFYYFFKLIILSPEKRIDRANNADEKVLKTIIWRKNIASPKKVVDGK